MKFKRSAFGYRANDVEDYIDELAERHEVELEHKDIEIRRLKTALEQAQQKSEESGDVASQAKGLEEANAQLSAKLLEAQQVTAQVQGEIARLGADVQGMDGSLREKDQKLQEALAEASALRGRTGDISRLEAMLAERDRVINQAEAEMQGMRRQLDSVEDLRLTIQDKEAVIADLTLQISSLEDEVARRAYQPMSGQESAAGSEIVSDGPGTALQVHGAFNSVDDIAAYLGEATIEAGSTALQRSPAEFERFRAMAGALRLHLTNMAAELGSYKAQERAISQAIINAQLKAAEIEVEALSDTMRKKADLEQEISDSKSELELTKKTSQKFKNDLSLVLEAYKKRLVSFGDAGDAEMEAALLGVAEEALAADDGGSSDEANS